MPILQNRMLTLIAAANEIYRQHAAIRQLILDTAAEVARGHTEADTAMAQLYNVALASSIPNDAAVTIAVEQKHFELMASRNNNAKRRAEMQRRLAGIPKRGPKSQAESAAYIALQRQPAGAPLTPISLADEALLEQLLHEPTPKDSIVHTIQREGRVEIETIVPAEPEPDPNAPLIERQQKSEA